MAKTIKIKIRDDILKPVLRKIYENMMTKIVQDVSDVIGEEISSVLEGFNQALDETIAEMEGGTK